MSVWTQIGENLVRHQGGTIYLRAKVEGKVIRVSLRTKDIRIAKISRDSRLEAMRRAAAKTTTKHNVRTVGDAIGVVEERLKAQTNLESTTLVFYADMIKVLNNTLPVAVHGRAWTAKEAGTWWKDISSEFAAQRANNVLMMAKRVAKVLLEVGLRTDDPTEKLRRKKIGETKLQIPSKATMDAILSSIREQRKGHSEEAANLLGFLAYSGCRHSQAKAFEKEHIEGDWLAFHSGVPGTKGARTRRLPISAPLRAILDRMDLENVTGRIFTVKNPRVALANACERLGLPHMRIHDLRHFFITYCLECGVDVATVAKWVGHKDGGVLILKTYGHIRDEHSLASAAKLIA